MPRYLISFNDGDMTFPESDFPAVAEAAHAIMREGVAAGIWESGGGFMGFKPFVVDIDGSVSERALAPSPVHIGGFTVVNVADDAEAFKWAHKIAASCRCAQEVRRLMDDQVGEAIYREFGR
jgi:hypothetical protein